MEAIGHSFGSVVHPVNSLRCDLFPAVIWPTESYLSLLGEPLYLQNISFPEAKINGFAFSFSHRAFSGYFQ